MFAISSSASIMPFQAPAARSNASLSAASTGSERVTTTSAPSGREIRSSKSRLLPRTRARILRRLPVVVLGFAIQPSYPAFLRGTTSGFLQSRSAQNRQVLTWRAKILKKMVEAGVVGTTASKIKLYR
ncbi:hypothetical protein [Candidatus Binatus sp.]|uniref:hypothetical protein n=1 Tax=Candidatus Binatus sp. TaxID=2811406 RepID=UPI002729E8C6|nr:hypothetical protein [Candidatus Binatus sp.]